MMTIVIGGSLFGVLGMILGVPLVASLYKIFNDYLAEVLSQRETKRTHLEVQHQPSTSSMTVFPTNTVNASGKITMEGPIMPQGSSKEMEDESQALLKLIHGDH